MKLPVWLQGAVVLILLGVGSFDLLWNGKLSSDYAVLTSIFLALVIPTRTTVEDRREP